MTKQDLALGPRSKELDQQDAVLGIQKEFGDDSEFLYENANGEPGDRQTGSGGISQAQQGHRRLGEERLYWRKRTL